MVPRDSVRGRTVPARHQLFGEIDDTGNGSILQYHFWFSTDMGPGRANMVLDPAPALRYRRACVAPPRPAFRILHVQAVSFATHLRGWKYRWFRASSADRRQGGSNTNSPSRRAIDASDADGSRSAYGTCKTFHAAYGPVGPLQ